MNRENGVINGTEMSQVMRQTVELEKRPSIGTILAIVVIDPSKNGENANNPMFWTILEKKPKSATERLIGQISFPADTRKIGEDARSNMLGSLPEFSESNELIRRLIFMPSSHIEGKISVKNSPVDLEVLLVDGFPDSPIVPLDADEVSANGWMSMRDLEKMQEENPSSLRSFVGQIVDLEKSEKIVHKVVEEYFLHPEKRVPLSAILPHDTSLVEFYNHREELSDVVGKSGVIYEAKK
jgi:hypothetical protein